MYDKTVRRRRAVLLLLVVLSLILLTAYFGEAAQLGVSNTQDGQVAEDGAGVLVVDHVVAREVDMAGDGLADIAAVKVADGHSPSERVNAPTF